MSVSQKRAFLAEKTANTKAQTWENAWSFQRRARRLLWLESNKKEDNRKRG